MSLADIKKLVKKSWFDLDEEGKDFLLYSTRENGSVGEESPGRADIQEAKRLRKLVPKSWIPSLRTESLKFGPT